MFGEIVDDVVRTDTGVLICFEDVGCVVVVFAGHFVAFHCLVANIHEVFKDKALLTEVLICLVPSVLGNVELVVKVKTIRNLALVHSITIIHSKK